MSYRHNFLVFFKIKCHKTFCRTELDMSLYHHKNRISEKIRKKKKNAYDHNLSYTKSYFRNTHWTLIKHYYAFSFDIKMEHQIWQLLYN